MTLYCDANGMHAPTSAKSAITYEEGICLSDTRTLFRSMRMLECTGIEVLELAPPVHIMIASDEETIMKQQVLL